VLYRFKVSIGGTAIFFKNSGKIGKTDFYPKQTRSYFLDPELLCKISSKSNQNCGRRSVYRQTDRMTDRRKWFHILSHAIAMGRDRQKHY